jgi:hypothetical protein
LKLFNNLEEVHMVLGRQLKALAVVLSHLC